MKKLEKLKRRTLLLRPTTEWNVYSAVSGYAPNQRVSRENPAGRLLGLVADYDMVTEIPVVMKYIGQIPAHLQPNFIEISLSNKIRLVWQFERYILTPSSEFCQILIETFFETIGIPTLLAGFDAASSKPTEMWTNGGEWYDVRPEPLTAAFCFGVLCTVSKKASLFGRSDIPIETIGAEVVKRWPGRWQGEFKIDALGVRFWDETADNPTGCQVKPDGILCFTGKEPFVKWEQIFTRVWCEEQRVLNLGKAAGEIYFDGKQYWEKSGKRWEASARNDILLRLKGRGLSDKCPKGVTQSDAERVLDHIQQSNRVQGAAPCINYPPGLVDLQGRRVLNTADLNPVQPVAGTGVPETDFPWLWAFLNGLFPRPELKPLDHLLAWLKRSYQNIVQYRRFMGQAVFLCGPKNNGKTLLSLRVIAPLMGNRVANPINFMVGETTFNSELFSAALLAVNDEDSPSNEHARKRMLAKLKGLVVNPSHSYHAKFEKPVTIDWTGRIFITLNDDPGSVGMLMEVESNTRDKQMFFATQAYAGKFPAQDTLEALIDKELPLFAHWLLNVYTCPPEVLSDDRMGVVSFFDPHIARLADQQTFAANLDELLDLWINTDACWSDGQAGWNGTPTAMLACLQTCSETQGIARDWSQYKIMKSLTALAKQENSRVSFVNETGREFFIKRSADQPIV